MGKAGLVQSEVTRFELIAQPCLLPSWTRRSAAFEHGGEGAIVGDRPARAAEQAAHVAAEVECLGEQHRPRVGAPPGHPSRHPRRPREIAEAIALDHAFWTELAGEQGHRIPRDFIGDRWKGLFASDQARERQAREGQGEVSAQPN